MANELSVLLDQDISLKILAEQELGDARLFVTTMKYEYFLDQRLKRYEQTAVVLEDMQLDLPKFSCQPRIGGIAGKAFRAFTGGFASVELSHSPEFNEKYWLHALSRDAVEVIFSKELCQNICYENGWFFAGNGPRLVIYKRDQVFHDQELDRFVESALKLLTLFQVGEEELDTRADLDRQVSPAVVSAEISAMNGIVGSMIQGQLRRLAVSTKELESFMAGSIPRTIPPGMFRQLVGENLPLVFVGIVFMMFGLGMGIGWLVTVEGKTKLIGLVFLLTFPVIGFCMSFFTWRSRQRKKRTLRDGAFSTGYVRDVKRTGTEINNQRQYRVTVEYDYQGSKRTTYTNQLGATVERARYFKDSGKPAGLLIHPEDPSIVICVDFVMLMD